MGQRKKLHPARSRGTGFPIDTSKGKCFCFCRRAVGRLCCCLCWPFEGHGSCRPAPAALPARICRDHLKVKLSISLRVGAQLQRPRFRPSLPCQCGRQQPLASQLLVDGIHCQSAAATDEVWICVDSRIPSWTLPGGVTGLQGIMQIAHIRICPCRQHGHLTGAASLWSPAYVFRASPSLFVVPEHQT